MRNLLKCREITMQKPIQIRLSQEIIDKITELADKSGQSRNKWVAEALEKTLKTKDFHGLLISMRNLITMFRNKEQFIMKVAPDLAERIEDLANDLDVPVTSIVTISLLAAVYGKKEK